MNLLIKKKQSMMRLKIKSKMLIFILSAFFIILSISAGFSVYTFLKDSKENLIKEASSRAKQIANKTQTNLEYYMDISRSVTQIFLDYETIPENLRRPVYLKLMREFLKQNPDILSVWSIWEPNSIDLLDDEYIGSPGCTVIGNFSPTFFREGDVIRLEDNTGDISEDQLFQGEYYTVPKNTGAETILEPYYYSYTGDKKDQIFQTNMIVPIIESGNFHGVVGVDVALADIQKLINNIHPYDKTELALVSNEGIVIANNNNTKTGVNFNILLTDTTFSLLQKIHSGKPSSFIAYCDSLKEDCFYSITPFYVGKTIVPWALILKIPTTVLFQKSQKLFVLAILVSFIGFILLATIIYLIANNIVQPLRKTNHLLASLSKGKLDQSELFKLHSSDEIGAMAVSANTLFKGLSSASEFAVEIGKNNLDAKFSLLSKKDVLGKSLLKMQESLKHAAIEREKRKEEEEVHRWLTNGLAKFGEILRKHHDIGELSNIVIQNLLDYINAVQGSLFMLNTHDTENKTYELTAAIAFERDKLIDKNFELGEGLVGRCAYEKKTIVLHDTPEHFVEITSGLNQKNPTNFLLVPLKINDDIFGVIELVSFNHFLPHQIEFVEKIGANIASTLNNLKINNQTLDLLEQAQQQKEELSAQEEEMRQNMEEMQTTQEESAKRENEIKGTISALNGIALISEYSLNKKLIYINDDFLKRIGLSQGQVINKDIDALNFYKKTDFKGDSFWDDITAGMSFERNAIIKFKDKNIAVKEHFSPVFDEDGEIFKIMNIGFYLHHE